MTTGPFAALAAMPCIATPGVLFWYPQALPALLTTLKSLSSDHPGHRYRAVGILPTRDASERNGRPSCTVRCRITSVIGLYSGESG
ncbi:hypothetical protein M9435_006641 [Picochlorum sp. BPE23]|nr:hypothetical protein M9435_006641 [Picochlorum sp. BPE23]